MYKEIFVPGAPRAEPRKKKEAGTVQIELPASFFYDRYIQKFSGLTEKGILHNIPAVKP